MALGLLSFYSQLDRLWKSDFKPSHQVDADAWFGETVAYESRSTRIYCVSGSRRRESRRRNSRRMTLRIRKRHSLIVFRPVSHRSPFDSLFDVGGQRSERRKVSAFYVHQGLG
jgi:hypothetical protein